MWLVTVQAITQAPPGLKISSGTKERFFTDPATGTIVAIFKTTIDLRFGAMGVLPPNPNPGRLTLGSLQIDVVLAGTAGTWPPPTPTPNNNPADYLVTVEPCIKGTPDLYYRTMASHEQRLGRWLRRQMISGITGPCSRVAAHPARYSGDLWHLAMALYLDRRFQIAVVSHAPEDQQSEKPRREELESLVLPLLTAVDGHQNRYSSLKTVMGQNLIDHEAALREVWSSPQPGTPVYIGSTVAATSVIVLSAARYGLQQAMQRMRTCLEKTWAHEGPGSSFVANQALIDQNIDRCIQSINNANVGATPTFVFVNMRYSKTQNKQHNISKARYEQISNECKNQTLILIRVGAPELVPVNLQDTALAFLRPSPQDTHLLDIYGDQVPIHLAGLPGAMNTDKRLQAYFWMAVQRKFAAAFPQGVLRGLIGGRSGGMDIANWMGMRTCSWDIVDRMDSDYLRLHWAAAFTSIIMRPANDPGRLDQAALAAWLSGNDIVPVLASSADLTDPLGPDPRNDAVADIQQTPQPNFQALSTRISFPPRQNEGSNT
jgi:hypothetical protein